MSVNLKRVAPGEVKALALDPIDDATRAQAAAIVRDVMTGGEAKLLEIATKFGDIKEGEESQVFPLVVRNPAASPRPARRWTGPVLARPCARAQRSRAEPTDARMGRAMTRPRNPFPPPLSPPLSHLPGDPYVYTRADMERVYLALPTEQQELLQRVTARVRAFATAQRAAITDVSVRVPGGTAGHTVSPCAVAGCYAPGGRYPLPSSVLMTAVTARVAGVSTVWVASPRPALITIGAAFVAGADALLAVGGAQAIAALAYGVGKVPACDVIVGPGNRWVTAAKSIVSGHCAIDMLAGPSECLVLADETADAAYIAADLLAQAEHDTDALPVLVTTSEELARKVDEELTSQLAVLPTRETASVSIGKGFTVLCATLDEAIKVVDTIAPEHLEVQVKDADAVWKRVTNYGGMFIGGGTAEVFGDYGVGPNHVLPTSGTARYTGGLSVFTFLVREGRGIFCSTRAPRKSPSKSVCVCVCVCAARFTSPLPPLPSPLPPQRIRTWLRSDDSGSAEAKEGLKSVIDDSAALARLEGLFGHEAAALARRKEL
jgi:histidinol dehydrogenase